jgi:hypothetical protein
VLKVIGDVLKSNRLARIGSSSYGERLIIALMMVEAKPGVWRRAYLKDYFIVRGSGQIPPFGLSERHPEIALITLASGHSQGRASDTSIDAIVISLQRVNANLKPHPMG